MDRPDHDRTTARNLPPTGDCSAWQTWHREHPEESEDGVGAFPAVAETRSLIEAIVSDSPGAEGEQYFMVVDLPNVYSGDPVIDRYNALLAGLAADWPQGTGAPAKDHVHMVTMSNPTQAVHSLMARYFVASLMKNGHALGRLDNDTYPPSNHLSAHCPSTSPPLEPGRRITVDVYEAVRSRRAVWGFSSGPTRACTCKQSCCCRTVAEVVSPPDEFILFCGMSIGFEDQAQAGPRTGRAPLEETVRFLEDQPPPKQTSLTM
ncbi:hypothetical protein [Streptomyces venezuelae]|uniref:hypothetical protein n=1 Tax=Streptomyces venezuelae TaxID=54571 RepID=UPI002958870B|nr:hypothetical protein [Streptomyces venezuelae]